MAFALTFDRRMGRIDEALQILGQPMVAASAAPRPVHPLLNDRPLAVVGDDEAGQIEGEAVLDGGAVDLGGDPACLRKGGAVEAGDLADRDQLVLRLSRMAAAA